MWTVVATIIVGAVIGALARLVLPGKQSISTVVTVVLGVLGSLIGSWAHTTFSDGSSRILGLDWIAFLLGIVAAAILIVVYGLIVGRTED
ncbi:GlsB/YeaQ/YmgE family stress response membrane protein [Janibacter corallicola]|uniref:GlsB/YeaQ/YmgE family stress response membrane protein n=1 Tax=Janibacter corallicola TaxID=415212 RepID=UPI00082AE727|nr:transglycosylase [Janibacter corallicola]